jgi:uncharacterized protein (DUF433 family)
MSLVIEAEKLPLEIGADGIIRVGGTRVTLDTVVAAFQCGATAEEIVQQYSSLQLADVYAVIGFYLRSRADVDKYVQQGTADADAAKKAHEEQHDPSGIRQRLLARRTAKRDA